MGRASSFERGASAKRKGRALEANPFAKRPGNGNRKKANDWAMGWHSCEVSITRSSSGAGAFKWPPLAPLPYAPEGDYGIRTRGLVALFRPGDPIDWERLQLEMQLGTVVPEALPQWARIPYTILWYYAEKENVDLGGEPDWELDAWVSHPIKFLYSALRAQRGECSHWPPLVASAYEELMQ